MVKKSIRKKNPSGFRINWSDIFYSILIGIVPFPFDSLIAYYERVSSRNAKRKTR